MGVLQYTQAYFLLTAFMKKYNWGIIGAGHIARKFIDGLRLLPNANLYAIASASQERADNFKAEFGFEKAFYSYQSMVEDENLDVVYIATTNNLHFEHTLLCLKQGKAVLCEKPFASDYPQVKTMIETARRNNVFLMEALWSRFIPSMIEFKHQVESGILGKARQLNCSLGFYKEFDPNHRVYALELGGGSLPDIGIYPIFLALYLFGKPEKIHAVSVPAPTGADWTTVVIFCHKNQKISCLSSSFEVCYDNNAKVFGEKGALILERPFHTPTTVAFRNNYGKCTKIPVQNIGNGYNYEAAEVMRCLDACLIESKEMPHRFSLDLMETIDKVYLAAKGKQ
ncbi:MAG: Gfo/Idh/MocA family oxidoreductase [Prevotellaceae bacterium]|jgi:predicted dehydrogenase|nr:Gfo/Idh/MocA family oxidoreductase [Prevotellaceae bacterium]